MFLDVLGSPVRVVVAETDLAVPRLSCSGGSFTEQDERICRPRGLLTIRACWWAIGQLRPSMPRSTVWLAARTTWRTVWRSYPAAAGASSLTIRPDSTVSSAWRRRARLASRP